MRLIASLFLLFALVKVNAQEEKLDLKVNDKPSYYQYDTDFLPASFHKARRDSLRALLPDSSAAVFFAAPERKRSNDVYYEYHQDPNFYYFSGYREPNAVVVIFKEDQVINGEKTNEIIYVQERDPGMELWEGRRLGGENAKKQLGFEAVAINTSFDTADLAMNNLKTVYFQEPEAMEDEDTSKTDNLSGLYAHLSQKVDKSHQGSARMLPVLTAQLRQSKTAEELVLLRKAIDITCEAQIELMKNIEPEMAEYETEAIIEYVFKKNGAEYPGFPSIQGSGENSCILHYTSNRRPLKNGGLLVSDVGAEYHAYTADVTRTIPPSGKFSKEEKQIYNLVLEAQNAGIEASVAGNTFWEPHRAALKVITDGLMKLKIIENASEVGNYFMHGTSHYLGLDVHDAGLYMAFAPNQVITVEPGIYIAEGSNCDPKWWNIGVRIEDDILITAGEPENLSAMAPRTIGEIEKLMQSSQLEKGLK
ncbi:MAG: aminopeptidase P N-terminal domain-containing protein [Vicingaceae bacterium]